MTIRKERLETHKTSETLFIGCGGVGSKIVAKVARKCVGNESENVRFVVFDTNVNDLGRVSSSSAKVTTIQTSSTQTVFEYLADDKEAFNNWFPNNQIIFDKTVSEGAGQVRAGSSCVHCFFCRRRYRLGHCNGSCYVHQKVYQAELSKQSRPDKRTSCAPKRT